MARSQSLNDGTVKVHSSIALLQERFKQLQRAKEMREERELLRQLIAESAERATQTQVAEHFEPKGLVFQSEMTVSQPQVSMYLQPSYLQSKQNYQAVMRRPGKLDDSDVDTSLHL
ncbi:uncharacterized protein LOC126787160 [Argentina anserina]|uniref:uncharacterized protein LOC126787160 n=1 Tax=Argentina anserina TaxID=57926 RepID=UPI002176263D|nr:uncharacterized protein LOC126787160 [Potentilla anserina]